MRRRALLLGDFRTQYKYGFYFLYLFLTALYAALLSALPASAREKIGILLVFTDPAALGLYFMGAIVLLEKGEHVPESLAVSPVRPAEYAFSKLCSLAVISTLSGAVIGAFAGVPTGPAFPYAVFLSSCLFSSAGLLCAVPARTLNQFILLTIPAELLISLPAVAYLFGYGKGWLLLHPGVCVIELCQSGPHAPAAAAVLLLWTALSAGLAGRSARTLFRRAGGAA